MVEKVYSAYYQELDEPPKARYRETLTGIGDIDDPYLMAKRGSFVEWQQWPEIEYPDIFNYLIATPSLYSQDQLKAYKSLDAYNFCANGWVGDISVVPLVSFPGSFLAPCTNPAKPAQSLIKAICYPENQHFYTKQTS